MGEVMLMSAKQRAALVEIIRVTVDFGFDMGRAGTVPKSLVIANAVAMAEKLMEGRTR